MKTLRGWIWVVGLVGFVALVLLPTVCYADPNEGVPIGLAWKSEPQVTGRGQTTDVTLLGFAPGGDKDGDGRVDPGDVVIVKIGTTTYYNVDVLNSGVIKGGREDRIELDPQDLGTAFKKLSATITAKHP